MTFYYGYIAANPAGVVTTLAGNTPFGYADGTGTAARFLYPQGVAVLPGGSNIVVIDSGNHCIRLVTYPGAVTTTLAGTTTPGFADGTGAAASFNNPIGAAVLPGGSNIVVADTGNSAIRLVTYPGGVVTTLAGNGSPGFADGTGAGAQFTYPYGVAVLSDGTIVVADTNNHCIRLVTSGGVVTTLAGNGISGFADGIGTAASFNSPMGVAVLSNGDIVVADYGNNCIRLVTPTGIVVTLAGSGNYDFADGTGAAASFANPAGVTIHQTGNIVVTDMNNQRIRLVTLAGVVTTLAGNGTPAWVDGTGTNAYFWTPYGLAVLPNGSIVVGDTGNSRIRIIA